MLLFRGVLEKFQSKQYLIMIYGFACSKLMFMTKVYYSHILRGHYQWLPVDHADVREETDQASGDFKEYSGREPVKKQKLFFQIVHVCRR